MISGGELNAEHGELETGEPDTKCGKEVTLRKAFLILHRLLPRRHASFFSESIHQSVISNKVVDLSIYSAKL